LKAEQLEMASQDVVRSITGAPVGFAGPVGLKVKIIADNDVKNMTNFVTGGNRKDLHLRNVNMDRDFKVDLFGDLRVIIASDRCPRCGSEINFGRGIEVGHIFKLGTKYSKAMKAMFLDEQGVEKETVMGCYGIGVSRTVAAAIEQNHDNDGIIFPVPIAPFEVLVLPLQVNEKEVVDAAEKIYKGLMEQGVDVLLDDRDLRAGFKFKDADLLGIPVRVTIGSRELKNGKVEMKLRTESGNTLIPFDESIQIIINKVKELYDSIK
jgi:prolyl-tRNA synthetase